MRSLNIFMPAVKVSVYTLVDITATGQIGNSEQVIFARNQQRNWETAHQIINLRNQVTVCAWPVSPKMVAMSAHEFGDYYSNTHQCWKFIFEVNDDCAFGRDFEKLYYDFDSVPIIKGLDETIDLPDAVFYTQGLLKNTYFKFSHNQG